jgi:hypothetical protein
MHSVEIIAHGDSGWIVLDEFYMQVFGKMMKIHPHSLFSTKMLHHLQIKVCFIPDTWILKGWKVSWFLKWVWRCMDHQRRICDWQPYISINCKHDRPDGNAQYYKIILMKFNADVLECDEKHPPATQCTNKLSHANEQFEPVPACSWATSKQENWTEYIYCRRTRNTNSP